jgi:peptide deformylase
MAALPIRLFGDPVLKEKCPEVAEMGDELDRLVRDMIDSLPRPGGAGLSANQIGIIKRIFIYDNDGEIEACINPSIVSSSEEEVEEVEGCLSLPGVGVPVTRHVSIELTCLNLQGEERRLEAEGWLARVFQHEIDHLDGTLILERTDRASRIEALELMESGLNENAPAEGPGL